MKRGKLPAWRPVLEEPGRKPHKRRQHGPPPQPEKYKGPVRYKQHKQKNSDYYPHSKFKKATLPASKVSEPASPVELPLTLKSVDAVPLTRTESDSAATSLDTDSVFNSFKMRFCAYYVHGRACPFKDKCHFAHGFYDLNISKINQNYKSKPCESELAGTPCNFKLCHFRHANDDPSMLQLLDARRKQNVSIIPVVAQWLYWICFLNDELDSAPDECSTIATIDKLLITESDSVTDSRLIRLWTRPTYLKFSDLPYFGEGIQNILIDT